MASAAVASAAAAAARRRRRRPPSELVRLAGALCATAAALAALCTRVDAHGRLIEPPSRASMWRYGFDTPPDYNDHEQYCGGFARQWNRNGGRCGVCGDAWDLPEPRPHEAGGVFGQGPVVRRWRMGSAVPVRVELTANHRGYFEFRLCARDRPQPEATQACLDAHLLRRAPAPGGPAAAARRVAAASASGSALEDEGEERAGRFFPEAGANRVFEMRYLLPAGVVCERCVLQWRYVAGNSWGRCENGTEAVGCGPQEEFRACADVAIDGQGERPTEAPAPTPGEGPTEGAGEGEGEGESEGAGAGEGEGERPPTAEEHRGRAWWAALVIVVASALAAAATLLLLYVYYYHAADVLKSWLRGRRAAAAAATGDYVS